MCRVIDHVVFFCVLFADMFRRATAKARFSCQIQTPELQREHQSTGHHLL